MGSLVAFSERTGQDTGMGNCSPVWGRCWHLLKGQDREQVWKTSEQSSMGAVVLSTGQDTGMGNCSPVWGLWWLLLKQQARIQVWETVVKYGGSGSLY